MSDSQDQNTPSVSQDEEEKFIKENLEYVHEIFGKLQQRETQLPADSRHRLHEFKLCWRRFFEESSVVGANKNDARHAATTSASSSKDRSKNDDNRQLGAIPKKRLNEPRNVKVDRKISNSDSSDNYDASHSSSSSGEIVLKKSTKIKHPKQTARKVESTVAELPESMSRLDMRTVLPFDHFNEDASLGLLEYLERFEVHCSACFRGSKDLWKGELERCLTNKTLEAYKSLRYADDTYESVKEKLLVWYTDMQDIRKEKNKLNFKRAKVQSGENMHMFAQRLLRLFTLAFPNRRTDVSKALREKFVDSVPKSFRKALRNFLMNNAVKGKVITWQQICLCARHHDLEALRKKDESSDQASDDDIAIHISRPSIKKTHDASTQCEVKSECAQQQAQQVRGTERSVVFKNQKFHDAQQPWHAGIQRNNARGNLVCQNCGRLGHTANNCKTRQRQCFSCGSYQHLIRRCPLRYQSGPQPVQTTPPDMQLARPRNPWFAHQNQRVASHGPSGFPTYRSSAPQQTTTRFHQQASHAYNETAPINASTYSSRSDPTSNQTAPTTEANVHNEGNLNMTAPIQLR